MVNPKTVERRCPECGRVMVYQNGRARYRCMNEDCELYSAVYPNFRNHLREPVFVYVSESRRGPL